MSQVFEGYERQYCEISASLSRKCTTAAALEGGKRVCASVYISIKDIFRQANSYLNFCTHCNDVRFIEQSKRSKRSMKSNRDLMMLNHW
jgi:hypothetical protein